ncbi:MAG TPA: endolytic transglycosylase MltG, partial [Alphaproteobacteria bacterium]|nr:endolytic transglycosylase MltG [Alphaproteobacteria bacterium]
MRRILLILLIFVAALAGAGAWVARDFWGPGPLAKTVDLVIPKGNVEGTAAVLAEAGIVAHPRVFVIVISLLGHRHALRAGEYRFPASVSAEDAMNILMFARPVERKLTVPEGYTTAQAIAVVDAAPGLEGPVPPALMAELGEGGLLPETYIYTWGDSREAMLERMHKAMEETLAHLWAARDSDLPLASPEQALILASIIEKETAIPEERAHIAAVFLNRLRLHMRLQSDPTVAFAITDGKHRLGRPLTRADLETPSPYNTYESDGLPPGPIDNPGKASIEAAMHPMKSRDL